MTALSKASLYCSFCFYAWLYIFCLSRGCMCFSSIMNTHRHTLSIHGPPAPCGTVTILPPALTVDPPTLLLGIWQCQGLMPVTSSITMSPLPPLALLSIVCLTVSGLVLAEDGAGTARSLCKWWKRVRELCWKVRALFGRPRWTLSWSEGAFSPLTVTSLICGDKKDQRMCLMSRFE